MDKGTKMISAQIYWEGLIIITGNAEVENYKLLLKTESSDNAILELRLS